MDAMDSIEELGELSESMRQAAALLADEDVDDNSTSGASSRRATTFLNVVALGNVVSSPFLYFFLLGFGFRVSFFLFALSWRLLICMMLVFELLV